MPALLRGIAAVDFKPSLIPGELILDFRTERTDEDYSPIARFESEKWIVKKY
jgi:hypothetical protein